MATDFKRVVSLLVSDGLITVAQVNDAIKRDRQWRKPMRSGTTWDSAKRLSGELNERIERNGLKPFNNDVSAVSYIELLIRVDGHTEDEIRNVIKWAMDDSFWYRVILNPEKLRQKFDTLKAQTHERSEPKVAYDPEKVRESMRKYDERYEQRKAEAVPMPANFKDILRKGKQ